MHEDFTVPVEYVRPIADQLRSSGVNVEEWLHRNGLAREPAHLLPYPTFRGLVLDALESSREPALGLFVGERLVATTHGMVGFAAINSSTVKGALEIVERFSRLRISLFAISHEIEDSMARVRFDEVLPLGPIQRPLLEAVVLSIKNVLDAATMGACQVHEVAFPFPAPEYAPLAREMFGCKVTYGQDWAGFSAAREVLDAPLKLADPAAFQEAALICQRELEQLTENETLGARVRRLLLEKQHRFPSLTVAARMLHVTPRTLHRRLVDEGTSYRAQLESVRHTLAVEHVSSGHFNMDEIAYRLGYTDLANFRRAFKRWEDVPPSVYRERKEAARRRAASTETRKATGQRKRAP
ncbi:MAG: AraC family transcriptional regulator [Myxococcales bacterium]